MNKRMTNEDMKRMNTITRTVMAGSLMTLLLGVSSGVRAVPISSIVTGTADVVFRETGTATITVTPVGTLQAGVHNARVIANATASATGGPVAYRWSPAGSEARSGFDDQRTLTGKADESNRLNVLTVANATASEVYPGWYAANGESTSLDITVMTASENQAVAADTYVVSLDAAVWGG
ncbi:hypothetical protein [Serratia ureilytica]|uniref:hypothetical protein n=1 Tax=Serratia ureilytica TaxID=300181 RepID=UPI0034C63C82